MAYLSHQFLLAMPNLSGTYFGNTITYVCEHNEDGALGLMVNRPLDLDLVGLLEQFNLNTNVDASIQVLQGGPVYMDRGFILHSDDVTFDASRALGHGLMLTTAREVLESIGNGHGPERFLVALGYAGWDAGQLEGELQENAWLTCPATTEILFDVPYDARIDKAAQTLGIDFKLMSGQAGHA
ncbi:MAG: YqgE/AlgH family protein [Gammaproteobacteria bacterium]|nr:YqgE/AlgH family protein [Gammaproteobacteria bacterium]